MTKATAKQAEEFTAEAKKTMEEGVEKMSKGLDDANRFGQQNVEAMVASGKAVAKAAEEMNAEIIAFSKKSYEDGVAAAKGMTAVKSASELFEMQTELAKSAFEGFVAQATRLNEMYTSAAKTAIEPLNERFTAAAGVVKDFRA